LVYTYYLSTFSSNLPYDKLFYVRSKPDVSQRNQTHGTKNKNRKRKEEKEKLN